MSDEAPRNNVLIFIRPKVEMALAAWELGALDDGIEALDRHMDAVASGRIEELEGRNGLFRMAWRSRNMRLLRRWQATGGPPGFVLGQGRYFLS